MAVLLIRHAVEDYDEWKPVFDAHAETRREYGSKGYRLFHVADDPDEVVALFEWESADRARAFVEETDLGELMAEAGVVGDPEIQFLEEIEAKTPETPRT